VKLNNPNLPSDEPYDWHRDPDNWPKTNASRCERYETGPEVRLDVDGDDTVESQTQDTEVIAAIKGSSDNG